MNKDPGDTDGLKHGFEDGVSGRPRNLRPDLAAANTNPAYLVSYAAAYEVAYNRSFRERELIIRRAAVQSAPEREERQSTEASERQAEGGREI